jgi:MbtH protein
MLRSAAVSQDFDDNQNYAVVLNDEEQYSIWPADRELPAGWRAEGKSGSRSECLDHIGEVWTDMRPLSLRNRMAAAARR